MTQLYAAYKTLTLDGKTYRFKRKKTLSLFANNGSGLADLFWLRLFHACSQAITQDCSLETLRAKDYSSKHTQLAIGWKLHFLTMLFPFIGWLMKWLPSEQVIHVCEREKTQDTITVFITEQQK